MPTGGNNNQEEVRHTKDPLQQELDAVPSFDLAASKDDDDDLGDEHFSEAVTASVKEIPKAVLKESKEFGKEAEVTGVAPVISAKVKAAPPSEQGDNAHIKAAPPRDDSYEIGTQTPGAVAVDSKKKPPTTPSREQQQQLTDRQVKARARRSASKDNNATKQPGAVSIPSPARKTPPQSPATAKPRSTPTASPVKRRPSSASPAKGRGTPPQSPSKAETARLQRNLQNLEARRRASASPRKQKSSTSIEQTAANDWEPKPSPVDRTFGAVVAAAASEESNTSSVSPPPPPLTMADIMAHHQELQHQKSPTTKQEDAKAGARRATSVVKPGAMAMAALDLDTIPGGDAQVKVVEGDRKPAAAVSINTHQQQQDAQAKARGSRRSGRGGRGQVTAAAAKPGAVAVAGTSNDAEGMQQQPTDAQAKARGARRSARATPGAVAVAGTNNEGDGPTRDLQAKSRGSRISNRSVGEAARPGAVSVTGAEESVNQSDRNLTQEEQDARVKARAGQRRSNALSSASSVGSSMRGNLTHQEPSTSSLNTSISGGLSAATGSSSMENSGNLGMEELARRREARAMGRESRRADRVSRSSQQGGTEMDSSDHTRNSTASFAGTSTRSMMASSVIGSIREDSTVVTPAASVAPASVASSTTSRSTAVFAGMDEDERQRRYDAKMSQMEQEHQDRLHGRPVVAAAEVVAGTAAADAVESNARSIAADDTTVSEATQNSGSVFAGMSEEERQRRFDAKMSDMSQGHADHLEKSGDGEANPADDDVVNVRSRDTMSKDFLLDSKDFSGPLVPEQARGAPNGGYLDQGVSSLPDVEAGEYRDVADNQLAVAVAIDVDDDEDETEKFISVHAVEYDPDSKPPIYKNRRFRLYAIGGGCLLLVVIIALVAASVAKKDKGGIGGVQLIYLTSEPTEAPTQAPTNARESLYRSFFADELNSTLVYESGTPHFAASEWIMNEDPAQLDIDSPRLLQRYMLAFWYYHTTNMTESPWRSCNPPGPGEDDSCVYQEFGRGQDDSIVYQEIPDRVRWMSSQNECDWQGAICGDGTTVVGIRMVGQDLVGTLPTEMRSLTFLQVLSIHYNMFTGTLPPEYANFRHLLALEVHGNLLKGQIPVDFYEQESKSLITLNVGDNALSGTLDTRLGQLTDLKGLFVFGNDMTGTIPEEISSLKYLTYTRFFGNGFGGQLPSGFGKLPQLTEFWYNNNFFNGTLPSEFGGLRRLVDFRLTQNQLSGPIPPELFNMTRAQFIQLDRNSLTGTLPGPELLQMTDLIWLSVSRNNMTGPIPTQLGAVPNLRLVWLHLNNFTGPVNDTICAANVPDGLNFLQADCAPLEDPPNPCRCCSACCDRTTGNCLETDNAV